MSWQFEFQAEKGKRLHRYFFGAITAHTNLWWCMEQRKFVPSETLGKQGASNYSPRIRTFKAFKRFLNKHPELKGHEVLLHNRYVGFNIMAHWKE